jgi:hypothetical protein
LEPLIESPEEPVRSIREDLIAEIIVVGPDGG